MKNIITFTICSFILLSFSCKKNTPEPISPPPAPVVDSLETNNFDYISFKFEDKIYICNQTHSSGNSNQDANRKVTISSDGARNWAGNIDSVLYAQSYGISSKDRKIYFDFIIFKKYAKKDCTYNLFYVPQKISDLFNTGEYKFPVDFGSQNTLDGVVIKLRDGNQFYSTTNEDFTWPELKFKQETQNNSKLNILKIEKNLKHGFHYIEVTFNCQMFDNNGVSTPLENGFMRLEI